MNTSPLRSTIHHTNVHGIYKHSGDRQWFITNYTQVLVAADADYCSSWFLGGVTLGAEPARIGLESWEVGQLMGGN